MKKQKVKSSWKHDFKMNRSLYLLTIPVVAYFLIFNYAPMFGMVIAFEDFKPARGIIGSRWVGLKNFLDFFSGPSFGMILRNTFVINLLGLVIGFPMTIIFALQLNEISKKWVKKSVQTLSYLPYFVSMVVMCGLVIEFCSTNGIITDLMVKIFHIERENLLQNPKYFWGINLLSDLWQGLGYGSIIFISAITSVSQELHEAAAIDNDYPNAISLNVEDNDKTSSNYSTYHDYMVTMIPKFIMGTEELSEDSFKAFVDQLNKLGVEENTEIYQRYYDEFVK